MMHHNLPVEDVVSVVVPPSVVAVAAPSPSVAPVVPMPLADNDGEDDWESFADSF